jgi:hypothetical protein
VVEDPPIGFPTQERFTGHLLTRSGVSFAVSVGIRHEKYAPESIYADIAWSFADARPIWQELESRSPLQLSVSYPRSWDEPNHQVPVVIVHGGASHTALSATLDTISYEIGASDDLIPAGRSVSVCVLVTRARCLPSSYSGGVELNSDGNVRKRGEALEPVRWTTGDHELQAQKAYAYEHGIVSGERSLVQVPTCRITQNYTSDGTESLRSILDRVVSETPDTTLLFSLFSRQRVWRYDTRVSYFEQRERENLLISASRRDVVSSGSYPSYEACLVHPIDLTEGRLFQEALNSLRSNPEYDAIRRAILFEVSARGRSDLEGAFILSVVALETAVLVLEGQEPTVGTVEDPTKWEAVRRALVTAVERNLVGEEFEPNRRRLIEMVQRANQPSIALIVLNQVRRLGVNTADIWPEGFEKGVRRALASRAKLLHRGQVGEFEELLNDIVRVQVLTERLLLKVLRWPDERVWRYHDQSLRSANRS